MWSASKNKFHSTFIYRVLQNVSSNNSLYTDYHRVRSISIIQKSHRILIKASCEYMFVSRVRCITTFLMENPIFKMKLPDDVCWLICLKIWEKKEEKTGLITSYQLKIAFLVRICHIHSFYLHHVKGCSHQSHY